MSQLDLISSLHKRTARDYRQRVVEHDKASCATVAKQWDKDYWDGDRCYGYGGMYYDGRWKPFAEKLISFYGLQAGDRVLDIGCGKAFLLYELKQLIPALDVVGLDISPYALTHAPEELRPHLIQGDCRLLPFDSGSFDLVLSITTLHNLYIYDLKSALTEIQRVGRERRYVCVESYRNEREKVNLMYWQLTCEIFFTPAEWEWYASECGYEGDLDFIFFE